MGTTSRAKRVCLLRFSVLLCGLLAAEVSWGAACCGGGFAAPALIVGDDRAQITTSYSYSQVAHEVGADLFWRRWAARETSETFKVEAAHIFWDRWQAGLSVPVVKRERAGSSATGFGDIGGTLGYEYLPDWDYNPWRPRGLGFLQLTFPTGKSIHESNSTYQLDSRGRGFWAVGLGTMLTKTFGHWDIFTHIDMHRSFPRAVANSQVKGRHSPGLGGNAGVGTGFNLSSWRFGTSLAWTYEDAINVSGNRQSLGSPQRFATALLSASYLYGSDWSGTLTYSDQALFGSPLNASLGRGATLLLQRRWQR